MQMFLPEGFDMDNDFGDRRMSLADDLLHLMGNGVGLSDRQTVVHVNVQIHVHL